MGLHDGHRQRKRQQFLSHGPQSMADHELLELALFYAIPRRDTNETAHRLLEQFGSLDRVLPRRNQFYRPAVANIDQLVIIASQAFLRLLDGQRTEQLYQLCVDAKGKVLSCRMLSQGQADMTVLSLRQVVENALLSGASGVFLGHNHPSGVALPSPADMEATTQVRDALKRLDIRLIDHIIVADGDYVSMASSGLLR